MATEALNTSEILSATSDAISKLTNLMSTVDEGKVNTVPYEGSWTAPQLLRHVTKSINGMTKAMKMDAKPAKRNPSERFTDFQSLLRILPCIRGLFFCRYCSYFQTERLLLNSHYQLYFIISMSLPAGKQGFSIALLSRRFGPAEGSRNISTPKALTLSEMQRKTLYPNISTILIRR